MGKFVEKTPNPGANTTISTGGTNELAEPTGILGTIYKIKLIATEIIICLILL